ncbi:Protein of unknown function DUF4128 [uncultured Caudovirales phage]|uniref:Uncharacterized protein n=1 Tax=uncultured Caudovirales phage TaxID=2100421 RepID=A0A6J7WXE5_9CAUD|nr:Protein of unknown function DUF4128 [uncultured Caudovirales phage]CAB5220774.1 Protein of unknown function DUF4128 [uncultured Caudovirales phage]
MTITNAVRAVFDNQLASTADIPEIAFQNVPYVHAPGTPFIKATLTPTSTRLATMGDTPKQRYQGLYRLLVCVPEAEGVGVGYDLVDTLLARFPASLDITYNGQSVTVEYSEVGASFLDSPYYCTPITVAWYTYHQ